MLNLLTFAQFVVQLKLYLYTTVHLLLEEFKNFSQVILKYTIIMSHNKSYKVGVGVPQKQEVRITGYIDNSYVGLRINE